jgi:hypothetical protein
VGTGGRGVFVASTYHPARGLTGEENETCPETRVEMINIRKSSLDGDSDRIISDQSQINSSQLSFISCQDPGVPLFSGAERGGVGVLLYVSSQTKDGQNIKVPATFVNVLPRVWHCRIDCFDYAHLWRTLANSLLSFDSLVGSTIVRSSCLRSSAFGMVS